MLMRNVICMLFSLVLLTYNTSAQKTPASHRELRGKVASPDNTPVPSVTVIVKGVRKNSAVTAGGDGSFTISLPEDRPVTLVISAVGHETREVRVDPSRNDLNIRLDLNTKGLNEVVVIGYHRQCQFPERYGLFRPGTFLWRRPIAPIDNNHLLLPIPQSELDLNPNLKPNPGY